MSALPWIVLQNSRNAGRLIFRGKTNQATITDQCSLKPATGIACGFGARRHGPPHHYSIVAPTARRIRVPCPKKGFATLSGETGSGRQRGKTKRLTQTRHRGWRSLRSLLGPYRVISRALDKEKAPVTAGTLEDERIQNTPLEPRWGERSRRPEIRRALQMRRQSPPPHQDASAE
jgi:hypothetical protein